MGNKYLIVYASCGQGHKQVALALKDSLKYPAIDILNYIPNSIKTLIVEGYYLIVKRLPILWWFMFYSTKISLLKVVVCLFNKVLFRRFRDYLITQRIDGVITTHFFSLCGLSNLKIKNICIITDIGVHPLWINKNVDMYLVGVEHTKQILVKNGVNESKVMVGRIPLRSQFYETKDVEVLRRKLNFDKKPVVLVLSSDQGGIPYFKIITGLTSDYNLVIIYGKNKRLRDFITKKYSNCTQIKVYPYYERISDLIYISSAVITKPGGITSFECLYMKKPLVITHYYPGQERENLDFLLKTQVGVWVKKGRLLPQILKEVIEKGFSDQFYQVIPTVRGEEIIKRYIYEK